MKGRNLLGRRKVHKFGTESDFAYETRGYASRSMAAWVYLETITRMRQLTRACLTVKAFLRSRSLQAVV